MKRPADSSVKRSGYKSRSTSPLPVKRLKEKLIKEDSPISTGKIHYVSLRSPSPRHHRSPSPYSSKMYADQPSTSKKQVFPVGKKNVEIDYVTIVARGPKMEKLNKRFQKVEQVAHGPFEFEENITIGIHRGPSHIELDEDVHVPVNYTFSLKTFVMIFPKKDYFKTLFDREEIKAFHHDDILDEEAYVEKRTITMKPTEKQKHRRHDDDFDYKITVGTSRDNDRRMVKDSGSGTYPVRSGGHDPAVPVTVRLVPKPDPRYEKIYREQQRYEDQSLEQETVHRKPNDLRHNLMKRKSDGEGDVRERDSGVIDARARIEARRHKDSSSGDKQGRSPMDRFSHQGPLPSTTLERKKPVVKTDLPDFKNRPDKFQSWKVNPVETPKGGSYYEHDNRSRDDMNYWERKQMYLTTGQYPMRGARGRGFRARGQGFVPRGRGNIEGSRGKGFVASMDEWKHDKFDEIVDDDDSKEKVKEKKERKTDKKQLKDNKKVKSKDSKHSTKKVIEKMLKENQTDGALNKEIKKEEESLKHDVVVELTSD